MIDGDPSPASSNSSLKIEPEKSLERGKEPGAWETDRFPIKVASNSVAVIGRRLGRLGKS